MAVSVRRRRRRGGGGFRGGGAGGGAGAGGGGFRGGCSSSGRRGQGIVKFFNAKGLRFHRSRRRRRDVSFIFPLSRAGLTDGRWPAARIHVVDRGRPRIGLPTSRSLANDGRVRVHHVKRAAKVAATAVARSVDDRRKGPGHGQVFNAMKGFGSSAAMTARPMRSSTFRRSNAPACRPSTKVTGSSSRSRSTVAASMLRLTFRRSRSKRV